MEKEKSIYNMLCREAEKPFKRHFYMNYVRESAEELEELLLPEGGFLDLEGRREPQGRLPDELCMTAFRRLACIAVFHHWNLGKAWRDREKRKRFLRTACLYCKEEADREDTGSSRFHLSVFLYPICALNVYFAMLPEMLACEGSVPLVSLRQEIARIAWQPWTLPARGDETDANPVSVERFRRHVWWEGANALCYRPLYYSALMLQNTRMLDVLAEVSCRCVSPTGHGVQELAKKMPEQESFWDEGICADGFGWGHGRQTYNCGYPTEGLLAALHILGACKASPWEEWVQKTDFSWAVKHMQAVTWGEYGSYRAPMMTRNIFLRDRSNPEQSNAGADPAALKIAGMLQRDFAEYLSVEERTETARLLQQGSSLGLNLPDGAYEGSRYFFNNEDLIVKKKDWYFFWNMASSRCDGVEFADQMADKRNYFTCDGSYILTLEEGREYERACGTWQVSHLPGVTQRDVPNAEIKTETNWRGYKSIHCLAAGIAGENSGAAGFLFEKDGSRQKDGAGELHAAFTKEILGIRAYKSCFVFGERILLLGAGITDMRPGYGRFVITTVENMLRTQRVTVESAEQTLCFEQGESVRYCFTAPRGGIRIRHGRRCYVVLEGQRGELILEERKTHWADLNAANAKAAASGESGSTEERLPVFELLIHHGTAPADKCYACWIDFDREGAEALPEILCNTAGVQAAFDSRQGLLQAIFYERTQLELQDCILSVSSPCALSLRQKSGGVLFSVSDGLQDAFLKEIQVRICTKAGEEVYSVSIPLPRGIMCGAQADFFAKGVSLMRVLRCTATR